VAGAGTASALSVSVTGSNATTTSLSGPSGDRAQANGLSITNSGTSVADGIGAVVTGASHYVSNAAADRPVAFTGGTAKATINSDYTINFTVTPGNAAGQYSVVVATNILGELTLLDDLNTAASTATVSDVTGRLGGVVTSGLGIAGIAQSFSTGTGVNDAQERNIAGSNSINLGTFTGTQSFVLRFTFSTSASAPQNVGGADEAAARFGANGPLSGATADDYPGPGDVVDRNQALDGHFVNISATMTVVPEPTTALMLAGGLAGLVLAGRKRS